MKREEIQKEIDKGKGELARLLAQRRENAQTGNGVYISPKAIFAQTKKLEKLIIKRDQLPLI